LFVFLVLAALYESCSLPFSVLLGTPVAIGGAFLAICRRDMELNLYAQIALILRIGPTAKNAVIVLYQDLGGGGQTQDAPDTSPRQNTSKEKQ
jgi:HAE1 family hydrophobic/amphiphilic exporter-1